MSNLKDQTKIGIVLNYINLIVGNIIPIAYTPIMLNLLGKSEYGLYKLASNVTSYLNLIALGIGSAVVRYLIQARIKNGKKGEEEIFGLFVIIFQIISIISLIVGIILVFNLNRWYGNSLNLNELHRMKILVFLLVLNMYFNFKMTPYIAVVNAHEKFIFLQSINIFTTCGGPILNLILLYCGYASVGMACVTLFLGIISRLVYLIYVRKNLNIHPRYAKDSSKMLKNILTFSFWIFVGNVVGQLYNSTDTVMIGAIPSLGVDGVAVYNVGLTFNSIMLSFTIGISNILSPKVNKLVLSGCTGERLTDLAIKVGRLQCYIMLLIITGFIAFGKPFLYFYAGKDYFEAYGVAIVMMIPNMIPLAQSVCSSVIVAQNKHKFRSIMYLGIALLNVFGTWILLKPLGIFGAAFMTGFALFLGQGVVMNWYYNKKSGINIFRFWKEVGSIFIYPFILCIGMLIVSNYINLYNSLILVLFIFIYTIIYCILIWKFSMNKYEKNLIIVPIKKLIRKKW